jgi:ketosteroid isomerase-like protein
VPLFLAEATEGKQPGRSQTPRLCPRKRSPGSIKSMTEEQQILRLFEDGDRALMAAAEKELLRIYAEDYVQYDETGKGSTREDLIGKLKSGELRFRWMISTGRNIRLLRGDIAVIQGSEEDQIEQDGMPATVHYVYTDVVVKREGRWQIVLSQLVKAEAGKPSSR